MTERYRKLTTSTSLNSRGVARFVFRNECLAKLVECSRINFTARSIHQIQIKMQIVQRNESKAENFFGFDEMANVATGKFGAGGTCAIVFNGPLIERELGVF